MWCVAVCLASLSLHANALGRYSTNIVETINGDLEGWVYAKSKQDIGAEPSKGEITLSGKLIATVGQVTGIYTLWGYPEKAPASIAILSLQLPYPRECPAQFVLVEIRKGEEPIVIDRFGNCNDDAHVSYKFGQVVIYFPKWNDFDRAAAETAYVYENGQLRKVKVTTGIRKGVWAKPIL